MLIVWPIFVSLLQGAARQQESGTLRFGHKGGVRRGSSYLRAPRAPSSGSLLAQHLPSPVYPLHCFCPGESQTSSEPSNQWRTAHGAEERGGSGEEGRWASHHFSQLHSKVISGNIRVCSSCPPPSLIHPSNNHLTELLLLRVGRRQMLGIGHENKIKSLLHKAYSLITFEVPFSLHKSWKAKRSSPQFCSLTVRHLNMG